MASHLRAPISTTRRQVSITKWPYSFTVTLSPGSTTVVDATSSMIAGP